jgi:hypothetical protein
MDRGRHRRLRVPYADPWLVSTPQGEVTEGHRGVAATDCPRLFVRQPVGPAAQTGSAGLSDHYGFGAFFSSSS